MLVISEWIINSGDRKRTLLLIYTKCISVNLVLKKFQALKYQQFEIQGNVSRAYSLIH